MELGVMQSEGKVEQRKKKIDSPGPGNMSGNMSASKEFLEYPTVVSGRSAAVRVGAARAEVNSWRPSRKCIKCIKCINRLLRILVFTLIFCHLLMGIYWKILISMQESRANPNQRDSLLPNDLLGSNYEQKLIIVPNAGTKPEEKHEVTETELILVLDEDLWELFNETVKPKLLDDVKGVADKESKITEVEIHQSSMGSLTDPVKLYHVFNVFRTTSEADGDYWWSLEKNTKHVVLQRSRNKDDVKDKLEGEERNQVKPIQESLKGKGSIKDLFEMILLLKVIPEYYNIGYSNCQSLVTFISKQTTEMGYEYKGSSPLPNEKNTLVELLQFSNTVLGVRLYNTEWPTLFKLIYLARSDLLDKVIQSGKYEINALYGGTTPLHFAIAFSIFKTKSVIVNSLFSKTDMIQHLLKDLDADPTTRVSRFGLNALGLATVFTCDCEEDILDLLLAHSKVKIDDVNRGGVTALHLAAEINKVIAVEKLLEKGANPNIFDEEGRSPLYMAAQQREGIPIIDLLLEAQKIKGMGDVNYPNEAGKTALHYAAMESNEITAEHLIRKGADPNRRDNNGDTPLHEAALGAQDMQIIDLLLSKIKDDDMNQYINDDKLLYNAYRNKNLLGAEIAARFKTLKSWADYNIDKRLTKYANPLIGGFKERHKPSTDFTKMREELRSLRIASEINSQKIEDILKEGKFDINSRDNNGKTPLFLAIGANNVNAVRRLLEKGADPTIGVKNGLTPIQVAVTQNKDLEILDLLLANDKVDINDGGKSGYTLLHWAMATSDVTGVGFLLSKGANPNVADQNGATPLHVAAYCADKTDVLGLILVNKEVDINRRDNDGQTALHFAVRGKRVDNVGYLLEKGADPAIRDENGYTPVHLVAAAVNQDSAILNLFLSNGKKLRLMKGTRLELLRSIWHLGSPISMLPASCYQKELTPTSLMKKVSLHCNLRPILHKTSDD